MSLVGEIREMPLRDVLQFLSTAGADGKLVLTSLDGAGLVVFRNGRVIYAASNSVRETLGSVLVCHDLVDAETLRQALAEQHHAREERRLGTILVEMGALSQEDLEEAIVGQVKAVIQDLLEWQEGFFRFEPLGVAEHGEVEVDAEDFLLPEGLDAQALAGASSTENLAGSTVPTAALPALPELPPDDQPVTLRSFMESPLSPWFTGEVVLAILRCASTTLARCVLFGVRGDRAVGMGGFGVASGVSPAETRIRSITVNLDQPSVVAFAVGTGETYRGALHDTAGDATLIEQLGGIRPAEVIALPVIVGARVVAVLYGDSGAEGVRLAATGPLETVVREAGAAMAADATPDRSSAPGD